MCASAHAAGRARDKGDTAGRRSAELDLNGNASLDPAPDAIIFSDPVRRSLIFFRQRPPDLVLQRELSGSSKG
jgi:hypothetical protein